MKHALTVYIVDDDKAVRDSLTDLVDSVELNAKNYANARDFLMNFSPEDSGCLVLDIRMPGMSGLELQEELNRRDAVLPIIFITAHGDVPMAVKAMRLGALNFIQKPFRNQELLDCINQALNTYDQKHESQQEYQTVLEHINKLTPREREVMKMIVDGKANKVIAIDLGLSQRTIEVHRANVMEKLQARSLAELVRIVTHAGHANIQHQTAAVLW